MMCFVMAGSLFYAMKIDFEMKKVINLIPKVCVTKKELWGAYREVR